MSSWAVSASTPLKWVECVKLLLAKNPLDNEPRMTALICNLFGLNHFWEELRLIGLISPSFRLNNANMWLSSLQWAHYWHP